MNTQRINPILVLFILTLAGFLLYFNAFQNDFVYDDYDMIVNNQLIRSLSNAPSFFSLDVYQIPGQEYIKGNYRPMWTLALALDYHFWGIKHKWGYHLTSLLLHVACALLFFLICNIFVKNDLLNLLCALLFLSFPISTFVIAYKSGKMELVFALGCLLCFLFYVKSQDSPNKRLFFYIISVFSFMFALLVKETAIIIPFLLISYDLLFENLKFSKKTFSAPRAFIRRYFIYLAILFFYFLLRLHFYGSKGTFSLPHANNFQNFPLASNYFQQFITAVKIIAYYFRLLLIPYPLRADYMFEISKSVFELPAFISIFFLLCIFYIIIKKRKKFPVPCFALLWIFLLLLPVSNFVYIGNLIAENYLYVASVGFFILLSFLFNKSKKPVIYFLIFVLFLTYSLATHNRNKAWKNGLALWSDTVIKSPKSPRAHLNLGNEYMKLNLTNEALNEFSSALRLFPDYALCYHNIGVLYLTRGDYDLALENFNKAIELNPYLASSFNNLGSIYYLKGELKRAEKYFKKTLEINPFNENAKLNLILIEKNKAANKN